MKILLVAKPWKGGLQYYIEKTLEQMFPGRVEYLPSYPVSLNERMSYLRNKHAWRNRLVEKINSGKFLATIILNPIQEFRALDYRENRFVWLVDAPRLETRDLAPYGKIFMSDVGYRENLIGKISPHQSLHELPFACMPTIHAPARSEAIARGACFIGNKDPKRDYYLQWLFQNRSGPMVYGNYFARHLLFWKYPRYFRPSVSLTEMGEVYAKYQVSINIHAQVVKHGTNMRSFECAAYGIPQVVEYRPGLENLFEPENEILFFSSPEECVEQANRLILDRSLASSLASCARQRALAEHTYAHRMKEILREFV